jgi:hypothetical protein
LVTVETVLDVFSRFGSRVLNVAFEESHINNHTRVQSGRGVVHYPNCPEGFSAAVKVSQIVQHIAIEDVIYDCQFGKDVIPFFSGTQRHESFCPSVGSPARNAIPFSPSVKNMIPLPPPVGFPANVIRFPPPVGSPSRNVNHFPPPAGSPSRNMNHFPSPVGSPSRTMAPFPPSVDFSTQHTIPLFPPTSENTASPDFSRTEKKCYPQEYITRSSSSFSSSLSSSSMPSLQSSSLSPSTLAARSSSFEAFL